MINGTIYMLGIGMAIVLLFSSTKKAMAVHQWNCIRDNMVLTQKQRVAYYRSLFPCLGNEGKFLADYGEVLLNDANSCEEALAILKQCRKTYISWRSIENEALACKCRKRYQESIDRYGFLSNYVPSMFMPKYQMALLYLGAGDTTRAACIADEILNMPVKVASAEVDKMLQGAERIKKLCN